MTGAFLKIANNWYLGKDFFSPNSINHTETVLINFNDYLERAICIFLIWLMDSVAVSAVVPYWDWDWDWDWDACCGVIGRKGGVHTHLIAFPGLYLNSTVPFVASYSATHCFILSLVIPSATK